MVPRRRLVLLALLVSAASTGSFVVLALDDGQVAAEPSGSRSSQGESPTGPLGDGARPGVVETRPAGGFLDVIYWIGALVSSAFLVVALLMVRHEVRVEKVRLRDARVRRAVANDLRAYRRVREGRRENT